MKKWYLKEKKKKIREKEKNNKNIENGRDDMVLYY